MSALLMLAALFCGPMPQCAEEDGSTQAVCLWSDGTGDTVLNLDYGKRWITVQRGEV